MRVGTCRLCNQTKPLIKAHIIPRSFFHQLKGGAKHLFAGIVRDKQPVEYSQSGFWDETILCSECESLFDSWDAHGFKALGNPPGNNDPDCSEADFQTFVLKDVDYSKLKLFVLGTLWRASVTVHKFFEDIDLGPHEEVIATLIRNGLPGPMEQYPIVIRRLIRQRYEKVIFTPRTCKSENTDVCVLYLPAIKFMVWLNTRPLSRELAQTALKPVGENIALPITLDETEIQKLQAMKDISKRWQPKRPLK